MQSHKIGTGGPLGEDSAMMVMLPWMLSLGAVQETMDSLWRGTLAAAYNRAARGDIEKAITTLRARLGQCMKGDFGVHR